MKLKTFKIHTLGCKVNQYDSQSIRTRFLERGFSEVLANTKVGYHIINTCTVTANADRQSKALIRNCRSTDARAKIVVTGCLVQKDSKELAALKGIDFVIGKNFFPQKITDFSERARAFLKIQDGCNNFCSYCKVPLVRGRSRSRPLDEVVSEARRLVERGFKEIVLTGICLGAYGRDLNPVSTLTEAVKQIENIDGLLRLRLSSIEALDVSDELIHLIAKSVKVCKHLHIPLQSADDAVLKKMHRRYKRLDFDRLIMKIKKLIPDIAITTDILVGFPGETKENFENTVTLIKKLRPLKVHTFPYSKRPGTPAAQALKVTNPLDIKKRILYLKEAAGMSASEFRKDFLNKKRPVLIEGCVKARPGYWQGYTDNYIRVIVKSRVDLRNKLLNLRLKSINQDGSMLGSRI